MAKPLIIVESPTKIKTLQKLLGDRYHYESSVGHIRDLPAKGFGIDIEGGFIPEYSILSGKEEVVQRLQRAAKKASMVYLCPDPDREGEAIAWHLAHLLPPEVPTVRATFRALTKDAVFKALEETRPIDMALVEAQQARRILDRLVGYSISPLLARRIARGKEGGLSAGRVQSVALKMVVDREAEIDRFVPVEYWTLQALLDTEQAAQITAQLVAVDGLKVEKEAGGKPCFLIPDAATAAGLQKRLEQAHYHVEAIQRKERQRHPPPPFITSTLQQEASRHHSFGAQRTMSAAQSLYEGVDLGDGTREGLITYMRTDSTRVAPEAVEQLRGYILSRYGKEFLPAQARTTSVKRMAQDAHEAIRPTDVTRTPEQMRPFLSQDQFYLYQLIWRRFVASQMSSALYDTVSVQIDTDQGLLLRASGSQLKFPGYLQVYHERRDVEDEQEEEDQLLPALREGESLQLDQVRAEQSFTKPPPRFTEASLIKELEKSGIGRPSTYATIMNKIQSRDYTTKEKGTLRPTELGKLIAAMLEANFGLIMQIAFTAEMEDELEEVAESNKEWRTVIESFWGKFSPLLEVAKEEMRVPRLDTGQSCPKCEEGTLQKIWAKGKYFLGCSRYPDCDYTMAPEEASFDKGDYAPEFDWEQPCPLCQDKMKVRHGRFGPFLGCLRYPECRGIVNIPKKGEPVMQEVVPCPALGCQGTITMRKSWRGKPFYSCSEYPACDVIVNELSQLKTKYIEHPKTPYVAKKKGARKGAAPAKGKGKSKAATKSTRSPSSASTKKKATTSGTTPSGTLALMLGTEVGSRPELTKRMWAYIKEHKLQDPQDGRIICPDTLMQEALGVSEPFGMMRLSQLMSQALSKMEGSG